MQAWLSIAEHLLDGHLCAVDMGHISAVALLLKKGADPNAQQEGGIIAVCYAVEQGCSQQVLPLLLAHGGNPNIKVSGVSMLRYASLTGHAKKVDLLLANGADIECKDHRGFTPLHRATVLNREEAVRILLRHGANIDAQDNAGIIPITMAAANACTAVEKVLLECGAER